LKLYHYSKELYPELLTKAASGTMAPIEIKLARLNARRQMPWPSLPYCDHISFFFEPIPSEVMDGIFGKGHPVWFKGSELYEYTVDLEDIPEKSPYYVAESPQRTQLFDNFVEEKNWVEDNPDLLWEWLMLESRMQRSWGEVGDNPHELEKQAKLYAKPGTLATAYLKASLREDFKDNFTKYASCVPHLMLYPVKGVVQYESVSRLVIGSKVRTLV